MGLHLVILASEGDRPLRIPLLILGTVLVLSWLASMAYKIWQRFYLRVARKRQLEKWTALAKARGFVVEARGEELVMRGTIAGRPFELDSLNFFGYGMDAENALRLRVEDVEAHFALTRWEPGYPDDGIQPPVGDEEFDRRYRWSSNAAGVRWVARFGPEARRLLLDFHELHLNQRDGEARIRVPYRLDSAHLDAACRLVEIVWGSPPDTTSASEAFSEGS